MFIPEGIIPAMVTPLDEDENLDEAALRNVVRRFKHTGVSGLFCLGTNGENYALTFAEKVRIAEIVVEEAGNDLKVYAGSGSTTTRETIQLSKKMEEIGVDAISVITPDFLAFRQNELEEHYRRVADSTPLPIVLYNIPARTGNSLQPATVSALAEIPNIVGIKDSSGSFDNMLQYIAQTPDDFSVLAGTDSLILSVLLAGGKGAIAATANVFPEVVTSIYTKWKNGNILEAAQEQEKLHALRSAFRLGTLPSVLKECLNNIGVPVGPARRPVAPLTAEAKAELELVIQAYREQGLL